MARTVYHSLFANALKQAIELRCVSPTKLYKRLGIDSSLLYNYLNGKAFPARKRHKQLCDILLVDLPYYSPYIRRQAYKANKLK